MNDSRSQGVAILGSTGSIGRSTLDVIAALPERLHVVALAAGKNLQLLQQQIDRYNPRYAACTEGAVTLRDVTVIDGADRLSKIATLDEVDIVVVATTGHEAIGPTIAALDAGKVVALANKESIVSAGAIVMPLARLRPGQLRPVDSEHSALWQCLGTLAFDRREVRKLVLTASGGPFRGWSRDRMATVTPDSALRHPNWDMGAKVTIDSSTLMNKGLEVIEAHWLFDCPLDCIDVIVHPQSLVHSLVEYVDGSIMAQIASHDMRLPIQYALTYPDRLVGAPNRLSVLDLSRLDFEPPDLDAFPLLRLARHAAEQGSTYPTVLSTADSVAVAAFLSGQLSFTGIAEIVEQTLFGHIPARDPLSLDAIIEADAWANSEASRLITTRRLDHS